MGIFSRISTLFKSEANAAIDKLDDPEKVLNQTIRDMQEQLAQAKTQVAESIAFEKKLKMQLDKAIENAKEWETKAMNAVNANRDDLAAQALQRKQEYEKEADKLRVQWQQQKEGCDKIRTKLKGMNDQIEAAKRRKSLLVAQAKRAEASKTINKTLAGINDMGAFDTFERMAEKVESMEAEAQASEDLAEDYSYSSGSSLEKEIDGLATEPSANDALAALKAKMGKTSSYTGSSSASSTNSLANVQSWDDL